jgi:hypothetical protein
LGLAPATSIIFVADAGDFSGVPEDKFYLENMQNKRRFGPRQVACAAGTVGTMMLQNVAIIVTGT